MTKHHPFHAMTKHFLLLSFMTGCLLISLTGCKQPKEQQPDRLEIIRGNAQTARCGETCPDPVKIRVLAGKQNVHQVPVKVTALTPGGGFTESTGNEICKTTDEGGSILFTPRLAKIFGEQFYRIECPEHPEIQPLFLRTIAGVESQNENQQIWAGNSTKEPMEIHLTDEAGKPLENIPVFFSLVSHQGGQLSQTCTKTDQEGRVELSLQTIPHFTGKYEIRAEIDYPGRKTSLVLTQLSYDFWGILLGVLAGLGFFIFGMTLMSGALQRAAGDRLKNLLQMCTGNRVKAMLAGVLVTALVQSSSACSVMVIGFVNASLLNLQQAIGIILGSAIGTTLTTQIISFKLDFLALPAIALGVLWSLTARSPQRKYLAETILGFGILFYGMTLMSSQLKGIAQFPSFIAFFRAFDCTPAAGSCAPPLWSMLGALLVGTVMTMIVQSSAATIGIAIALAESNLLNFYTAIPLILGDNIGTTITGLLAGINASAASRQTAAVNTIFKVLGALLMIPLFYIPWRGQPCFMTLVDLITAGDVFAELPENIGRHMASAHTLFNICNVAIFLPMVGLLAWIGKRLIPEKTSEAEREAPLVTLERRLLKTPSAALSQVMVALTTMQDAAMQLTTDAILAIRMPAEACSKEEFNRLEQRIDNAQHAIIDYLVALTQNNLSPSQAAAIPAFMHCVNDMERIGDRACNIFELVPETPDKGNEFSPEAIRNLREIDELLQYMNACLLRGLRHKDMDAVQKVLKLDGEAKHMTERFEQGHEVRLRNLDCTVEKGLRFIEILANLERIASHLTNVADRAPQLLPHSVSFGA